MSTGEGTSMDLNTTINSKSNGDQQTKLALTVQGSSPKQCIPISMNMEISPIYHAIVLGKGNHELRMIMQRTNTTILFPNMADPNVPSLRYTVHVLCIMPMHTSYCMHTIVQLYYNSYFYSLSLSLPLPHTHSLSLTLTNS